MLKSCFDCIFGNTGDQSNNEVIYNTQVNGHSQEAPPWPQPIDDSEMFVLPRKLNIKDQINISAKLKANPNALTIQLIAGNTSPDYENIACHFEARFPNNNSDDNRIIIKVKPNGYEEILGGNFEEHSTTDLFPAGELEFGVALVIPSHGDAPFLKIFANGQYIHQYQLKHNLSDLKFLMLGSDVEKVEKLDFTFS